MSSLGDTLRERRNHLGLSLAQVEDATKIRARILQALEEGDHSNLPNPGYVRGFVSSYARFLELDPQPLLQMYKAETGHKRHLDLDLPQISEAVKPTGQQHALPARGAIMVVIAIAIISLGIWTISSMKQGRQEELPPVPVVPNESSATTTPATTTSPTDDASSAQESTADTQQEVQEALPFTLVVSVDGDASWLRITVDGRKAYEGVLADGQSKRYEVADEAEVRVGKPSVVSILKDGKKVSMPAGDTPTVTVRATQPE